MDVYGIVNKRFMQSNPIPAYAHSWGVFQKNKLKNYRKLIHFLEDDKLCDNIPRRYQRHFRSLQNFYASIITLEGKTKENSRMTPSKVVQLFYDHVPGDIVSPQQWRSKENLLGGTLKAIWFVQKCRDLAKAGFSAPLVASISIDLKNNQQSLLCIKDGGLSLPHISFYQKQETIDLLCSLIKKYCGHFMPHDNNYVAKVVEFEASVSAIACSPAEKNDPTKSYNNYSLPQLRLNMPHVPWSCISSDLLQNEQECILIECPAYVENLFKIVDSCDQPTLEFYFFWRTVLGCLVHFNDPDFDKLYYAHLEGLRTRPPVELRRLETCLVHYGNLLCMLFQRRYHNTTRSDTKKKIVRNIVDQIKSVLHDRVIHDIKWMCQDTKDRFICKLSQMRVKIGGEDWDRYSLNELNRHFPSVETDPHDFFGNMIVLDSNDYSNTMCRHRKPTDRLEWFLNSFEVNAYYSPELNEIVFPWGILVPPFFCENYPAIKNVARLGSIVGHEIIHGFDNHGSFFDESGNLNQWWHPEDKRRFAEKTKAIERLYSGITFKGIRIDGQLTCPENIADITGLRLSFECAKRYHARSLLDLQKFFVYYAHTLCSYHSPEHEQLAAKLDSHSPANVRINTSLEILSEFLLVYGIDLESGSAKENLEIY